MQIKSNTAYGFCTALILFITGWTGLFGQLRIPGKPVGDYRLGKAAETIYMLPPPDSFEIDAKIQANRARMGKSFEFAIERQVDLTPSSHGSWSLEEGMRIWRVHIISPGAYSMGLIFREFRLEKDVNLMVFDPALKHIRGAYSELNNKVGGLFAIGHTPGDELIVELQVPKEMMDFGELSLGSVSHAFLDVMARITSQCSGEFGCSKDCEIDVNCIEGNNWELEKRSVVRLFTSTQFCTGVLLNNTAYNGDPLLLTAKHCIDTSLLAQTSIFDFNYESPSCFGGDGPLNMSITGSKLLALGDSIDFSLVRLSVKPPESFNAYYAGWNLSQAQNSGSTAIHHPEGDVKKISFDLEAPSTPDKVEDIYPEFREFLYFSFWWIKQWDTGSTEPGSSGSPLFNDQGQVLGILSWGAARCGDSISYDGDNDRIIFSKAKNVDDFYSKLSVAWDYNNTPGESLKAWLDPLNSGVSEIGGYEPSSSGPPVSASEMQYDLFPNPAYQQIHISRDGGTPLTAFFRIYDLQGRLYEQGSFSSPGTTEVDISHLTRGFYFVQIREEGNVEVHKLLVE